MSFMIDRQSARPLQVQIYVQLRDMIVSRQVRLARRPVGEPDDATYEFHDAELPPLEECRAGFMAWLQGQRHGNRALERDGGAPRRGRDARSRRAARTRQSEG